MEQNPTNVSTPQEPTQTPEPDKSPKLELSPEMQALFDQKVQEATRKAAERAEKRIEEQAQKKYKEIEEAERLRNMTEAERQAEIIKRYEAKIAELELSDLVKQIKVELSNEGLPQEFADIIPVQDAEKAKEAINFLKNFKASIVGEYEKEMATLKDQLKAANLRQPAPKATGGTVSKASPQFEELFKTLKPKQ